MIDIFTTTEKLLAIVCLNLSLIAFILIGIRRAINNQTEWLKQEYEIDNIGEN